MHTSGRYAYSYPRTRPVSIYCLKPLKNEIWGMWTGRYRTRCSNIAQKINAARSVVRWLPARNAERKPSSTLAVLEVDATAGRVHHDGNSPSVHAASYPVLFGFTVEIHQFGIHAITA